LSGLYFLLVGVMVWIAGFKWLLIGSISFMIMVMYYTLWIVHEQSRACIEDLKAMREGEIQTQLNDSKESL
jgi:cell division protein FtsW (lipid II flippase)